MLENRVRALETELSVMRRFLQAQFPGDFLAELPDSHLVAAPDLNPVDLSRITNDHNNG